MRAEQQIFDDLAKLCSSPGYAHAIAYLCFRDNTVGFAGEMTAEDMRRLYSPNRLIRTEISTLIGLLVKSDIDYSLPPSSVLQEYIDKSEALLKELHQAMTAVWTAGLDPQKPPSSDFNPFESGNALREPIFYSGESAYNFQYRDLAARKYQKDDAWLEANKGFSIRTACDVFQTIQKLQDSRLSQTVESLRSVSPEQWTLLSAYSFTAQELAQRSGLERSLITKVIAAFAVPANEKNKNFRSLHDFNVANAFPLLRSSDDTYLLFQDYSLAEALYETPFYWMAGDGTYRARAMEHRGQFTETFCKERLERVFGKSHVYANVDIFESKGKKAGEIDVLAVFGNRLIVLQAKSKRLTLEARKGNDGQIRDDFKKSILDSYEQGHRCAKLLVDSKHKFVDANSQNITIPTSIKEIYIFCVVSDHYPALSFQARQFLKVQKEDVIQPPFIMDVFTLDAMTEMLESPLYLLSYANRRTSYSDRLMATHELTILSDHLKRNLWLDDQTDMVLLGDDISADLDVAMAVRRDGIPGNRTPDGILTRLHGTTLGRIVQEIESRPDPATIDLGFMLLSLGEKSFIDISRGIDALAEKARTDFKSHDLTVAISGSSTGLTIHCNKDPISVAEPRLRAHCESRKYTQHANSWFGICIRPADASVRFGLSLGHSWLQDDAMDAATANLPRGHKPSELKRFTRRMKIGRNQPCPCGSGKKYKKCHGQP